MSANYGTAHAQSSPASSNSAEGGEEEQREKREREREREGEEEEEVRWCFPLSPSLRAYDPRSSSPAIRDLVQPAVVSRLTNPSGFHPGNGTYTRLN